MSDTRPDINHIRTVALIEGHDAVHELCTAYEDLEQELESLKQSVGYIVGRAKEQRVEDV